MASLVYRAAFPSTLWYWTQRGIPLSSMFISSQVLLLISWFTIAVVVFALIVVLVAVLVVVAALLPLLVLLPLCRLSPWLRGHVYDWMNSVIRPDFSSYRMLNQFDFGFPLDEPHFPQVDTEHPFGFPSEDLVTFLNLGGMDSLNGSLLWVLICWLIFPANFNASFSLSMIGCKVFDFNTPNSWTTCITVDVMKEWVSCIFCKEKSLVLILGGMQLQISLLAFILQEMCSC